MRCAMSEEKAWFLKYKVCKKLPRSDLVFWFPNTVRTNSRCRAGQNGLGGVILSLPVIHPNPRPSVACLGEFFFVAAITVR